MYPTPPNEAFTAGIRSRHLPLGIAMQAAGCATVLKMYEEWLAARGPTAETYPAEPPVRSLDNTVKQESGAGVTDNPVIRASLAAATERILRDSPAQGNLTITVPVERLSAWAVNTVDGSLIIEDKGDAMTCPSCGINTTDYECWNCDRFLGGKGIVRLSDTRYQYKTGRHTYYIKRAIADESTKTTLGITTEYYYVSDVDGEPVFGVSLTSLCEQLRTHA